MVICSYKTAQADQIRRLLELPAIAERYFGESAIITAEGIERYVRDSWLDEPSPGRVRLTARAMDSGRVLGAASVWDGALTYFVDPSFWRQGIAKSLLAQLCAHPMAMAGPHGLHATVQRENLASIALLEAAGFKFAGMQKPGLPPVRASTTLKYV